MPNPIYMPEDQRFKGISTGLGQAFTAYEQKQEMKKIQDAQRAITEAPDRASAEKIFSSIDFKTPEQMQAGFEWLDSVHPKPKPNIKEFYAPNESGAFTNIGKGPLEQRPANALTADELEKQFKAREDARAEESARLAQERFDFQVAQAGASKNKDSAKDEIVNLKAYNNVVASMLNVKKSIGQSGEIILDFGGDSRVADAYRNALEKGSDYMRKFGGDINKAANAALKEAGAYDRPAEATTPAAPAAPEGGPVTQFLKDLFSSKPSAATPKAATGKATAPEAAINFLKSNNTPDNRKAFKDKYGYLP